MLSRPDNRRHRLAGWSYPKRWLLPPTSWRRRRWGQRADGAAYQHSANAYKAVAIRSDDSSILFKSHRRLPGEYHHGTPQAAACGF
eukprot:jgi/Chlat1/899/Chrsp107S01347